MGGDVPLQAPSLLPRAPEHPVGQRITKIYTDRLRQFTETGQYRDHNLISKLYDAVTSDNKHVKLSVYSPPDLQRPNFEDATSHEFTPTHIGASFGPSWSTHWFRIQLTVPQDMRDKDRLEFHWDANNEGLVWAEDGRPLQGLTGGGERVEWAIPDAWRDGKEHTFYIEMACNAMFGNAPGGDSIQPPAPDKYYTLHTAQITAVNVEARALFYDFWIIGDAAREFPRDSWESHQANMVANAIMDAFEAGNGSQESIREGRKIAQKYLGDKVDSAEVYGTDTQPIVYAIGHCHIDSCWLWPWAETKRKVARSWSNQCDLMDRYPEHRFACSQAQQFKWLEQHYPSVFDRVKRWVKKGNFHPIGGSWVEHDTNMPSGESLVRQFVYGQRYFESRFGERCSTFWLPDTFGYSSQIPQICRLAGMSRFFTQKLSWNNINNFPHTTFKWVALDGSQVLCHMAPSETYTASAHFGDVKRSVSQHKSMDADNTSLLVFGKGDGGGGPTFEHMEKLRRCRGLSDKVGLLPRVKMGDSVDDFFARLERKAADGTQFATWYGELYFELHRGTYTTQANNKLNNRKSEFLLRDLEYLATLASLSQTNGKYEYPKQDIDDMWEGVLLCQFHDCLPGSSIEMCYDDSDELYAQIFKTGERAKQQALKALGFSDNRATERLVAINTLPWPRSEIVRVPDEFVASMGSKYVLASGRTGLLQCQVLDTKQKPAVSVSEIQPGVLRLENEKLRVDVKDGVITSLYDLEAQREVVAKGGKAGQLVIFDDKPLYWQAWDVEVYHLESRKELRSGKTSVVEQDLHRVSVVTKTAISDKSWVKTTISLAAAVDDQPSYVEMESEVEWQETMKFLKVEFPVDITNTEASYETQYGITRRPTHYNTSWDMAKFEVCCHKWADLSEYGYGVSILNDSKYGFATCGNLMRLSLLRAPKAPDAHADMGRHHIRYAILPHSGPLDARTVHAGYNFNSPLILQRSSGLATTNLLNSIKVSGSPSLILDAVKRGEDDEDVSRDNLPKRSGKSIILRIYESMGGKSRGFICSKFPVKTVWKCNVLEDDEEPLEVVRGKDGVSVEIELRAFEVATYRLQL
ncbi:alpha-mannosidase [Aspergillus clavatus NRRL 1]|uniref:Alpha-mannosidase n=1 Tax=Aspergillus clavatus (strain ATCC 1007 / CBS 513.65 / DSM 816 / NCTC 3887 / NRRL 1 / QM 1276 / 107) TaxID=344612 RepID=A1CJT9_ASPCL|nr:alpha-mannosidase [Aspergillus clavatus NRRL 1]EAW09413.1 alpha-mannosidase [Aspergillus clavatus NRRL 1]